MKSRLEKLLLCAFVELRMLCYLLTELFSTFQYTQKQAKQLRLVGWVHNTRRDTVEGLVQGDKQAIEQMYVFSSNSTDGFVNVILWKQIDLLHLA